MPELYTLIGDMVGSRRAPDRAAVQEHLGSALAEVNRVLAPAQDLEPTVGDEFQGAFGSLADALLAAVLVRLSVLPVIDVRCGIGHGEVTVHDTQRRPLLQDGPGWWNARFEALEVLGKPRKSDARTWYGGQRGGAVNAFLLTRDALVDRLNDRGRRMLRSALLGATQQQIARDEGVSKSAVSQQFARGIGAIRDAHLAFEEV